MKHAIDLTQGPAQIADMAEAVSNCVHCGFCLPACPTYQVQGEELDSPRGRIFLMKESLEGALPVAEVMPYIDRCLGCMACVTACPSGVEYGALLAPFRALGERSARPRDRWRAVRRQAALRILPYPRRLQAALALARWTRPLHAWAPTGLQPLLQLVPDAPRPALRARTDGRSPAAPTARVALLPGCAQSVLAPGITQDATRVLQAHGIDVAFPASTVCCGALDMHAGESDRARSLALDLCAALPSDVEAVLTSAAGCGSGIQEYPLLFKGQAQAARAQKVAARTQDVAVYLSRWPDKVPFALATPLRVAYHDACHLQHAQGVTTEPRALLQAVEGLELIELPDAGFCCGSAGIYNIDQPETARVLGQRKAQAALDARADVLVTGNVGCLFQIQAHLRRLGSALPVRHTMQLLASALPDAEDR